MKIIDPDFLALLRCPDNHQPLFVARASVVAEINKRIDLRKLMDRTGDAITERVDAALVRQDGRYAYPIRDGIPNLLQADAIPLEQVGPIEPVQQEDREKPTS